MSQTTFFKIDRKLLEHPLWLSETFTKAQAWIDLIGQANHSPGFFFKRSIQINVDRGQTGKSIETWMKRWKWSKGKVSRFLNWLEKERMILQKRGNQTTVITICNYESYQGRYGNDGKPSSKPNEPQTDGKQSTNNNENNEKKKKEFLILFEKFWKIYPARNGRKLEKKKAKEHFWKLEDLDLKIDEIMIATKNYKAECDGRPKDAFRYIRDEMWKDFIKPLDTSDINKTNTKPEREKTAYELEQEDLRRDFDLGWK